jgi:hypothetical protein
MGSVVVPKDSLDLATVRRKAQVCASQLLYPDPEIENLSEVREGERIVFFGNILY